MKTIRAADLFCGAGGTSLGLSEACKELGYGLELLAVNHWPIAIATHSKNHKLARHLCETLDSVDPRKVVPGGRLDLLVASPECTHHSNARGGRPMSDQSRASAWHVVRWAEALRIDNILIENVREFRTWGPLGLNGRPMKSRRGETYQAWLKALESLGYRLEDRILNAADYGDPTTRERLFILCRRRRPVGWPEPTHSRDGKETLFGLLPRWRAAREIIDWADKGSSIFNRKRPLSPNTIRRIAVGLRKFSGLDLEPYLVKLYGTSTASPIGKPAPTVTGGGGHLGVAEPFLIRTDCTGGKRAGVRSADQPAATIVGSGGLGVVNPFVLGQQSGSVARGTDQPVPAVAGKGAIAKVEPFLVAHFGERDGQVPRTHSVDQPTPTVTQRGAGDLVQPFIAEYHGGPDAAQRVKSTEEPLPTQTTEPRFGLAQPFMMSAGGPEVGPRSTEDPAHTVLTSDHIGLTQPFITGAGGPAYAGEPQSVDKPMGTVVAKNSRALVQAFLVQYNGTSSAKSVDEPVGTVTGKDRFALLLVMADGQRYLLDILFRMLKPRELARAQGFPDDFQFEGTTEQVVRQIGNAVPRGLAKALCKAALL